MDFIWHAAVLDTRLYERLQQHVGMKIHHNPGGASRTAEETPKRNARLDRMAQMYQERFSTTPIGLRPHEPIEATELLQANNSKPKAPC